MNQYGLNVIAGLSLFVKQDRKLLILPVSEARRCSRSDDHSSASNTGIDLPSPGGDLQINRDVNELRVS